MTYIAPKVKSTIFANSSTNKVVSLEMVEDAFTTGGVGYDTFYDFALNEFIGFELPAEDVAGLLDGTITYTVSFNDDDENAYIEYDGKKTRWELYAS